MNKIIIGILVIAVIGGGILFLQQGQTEQKTNVLAQEDVAEITVIANPGESSPAAAATKTFTVEGGNFTFSVKEMKVKKGDNVQVVFQNKEGFHDWILDEFNAKTKQIKAGETETIEFVADKIGTFEYYCSVGKHRQMGMVGKLIVE